MEIDSEMNGCSTEKMKNRPIRFVFILGCALLISGQFAFAEITAALAFDRELVELQKSLDTFETKASRDQKKLRRAERLFSDKKKALRSLRAGARAELRAAEKTLSKVKQSSNQIQRDIDLYADRINEIERDSRRAQARIQAQNVIAQEMNRAQHNKLLERNESKVVAYQVKMAKVESEGNRVKKELEKAEFELLRSRSKSQRFQVDDHPELVVLRRKMDALAIALEKSRAKADRANDGLRIAIAKKSADRLTAQQNSSASKIKTPLASKTKTKTKSQIKPQPVQSKPGLTGSSKSEQQNADVPDPPAYVFVISGDGEPIENKLELKSWVESYGAVYIQGRWNNLYPLKHGNVNVGQKLFLRQISAAFKKVPKQSNVILIGHGQGGGAAISAATQVASKMGRRIDYLIALDPMGEGNLRANIVYKVKAGGCSAPSGDTATNKAYLKCLADSSKRVITANVKNFYNRWQKETGNLGDLARVVEVQDEVGRSISMRSSTGKFSIANAGTKTDQKRVFYWGSADAHQELLEEASAILPNLLVRYIH